jgi:hypothetical protein
MEVSGKNLELFQPLLCLVSYSDEGVEGILFWAVVQVDAVMGVVWKAIVGL